MVPILQRSDIGLYCSQGDFYIDPQRPVRRAVITHAHSDHARWGSEEYLAAASSKQLLKLRLSPDARLSFLDYGQSLNIGGLRLSLHPAGHMLGSAQVRLEYQGRVEVVTGDYKLGPDATCAEWEPIRCHLLVTESTFGLPVYRWPDSVATTEAINAWWRANQELGFCSVLYGYAVGKSQRLIADLNPDIGRIYTHGAVEKGCLAYRATGVALPHTTYVGSVTDRHAWKGAMVVAVPSAHGTTWTRRFGASRTAMASGWMMVRGMRRRRNVDRGFIVSDHVDWPSLLRAVDCCDPEEVWVTHGYASVVARFLSAQGRKAVAIDRRSQGTQDEEQADNEQLESISAADPLS